MTEQLYRLEHRDRLETSSGIDIWDEKGACYTLRPVPATHTLAWAMGEMYAQPMREYRRHPTSIEKMRWNGIRQCIEQYLGGTNKDGAELWDAEIVIDDKDMASTSWSPCEAEAKPVIIPGTRNWLHSLDDGTRVRHTTYFPEWAATKSGDKVIADWWGNGDVPIRIDDCADMGWDLAPEPKPAIVPGSREWLASLQDGTRVRHTSFFDSEVATKRGGVLFITGEHGDRTQSILICSDSGWSLAPEEPTQPQAEPCGCSEIPDTKEDALMTGLLVRVLRVEQRVERLERMMEVKR